MGIFFIPLVDVLLLWGRLGRGGGGGGFPCALGLRIPAMTACMSKPDESFPHILVTVVSWKAERFVLDTTHAWTPSV